MRTRSRVTRTTATAAATAMMAAGLIALTSPAAQAAPGVINFPYVGPGQEQVVVPAGVTQVTLRVNGAGGGAGGLEGGSPGRGATGLISFPVTAGDTINMNIGSRGTDAATDDRLGTGTGGAAGGPQSGGSGGTGAPAPFGLFGGAGGGGGGGTEVLLNGNLVAVAGGGGGGGGTSAGNSQGGDGGGAAADGQDGQGGPTAPGGKTGDANVETGGLGDNANGNVGGGGGGGGGGGHEGGSQGATVLNSSGAGGGGGSNWVDAAFVAQVGAWDSSVEGNGSVTILYNTTYETGISIDDPNTVVTGQDKSYTVNLGTTDPAQTLSGSIELTVENLTNGATTSLGTKPVSPAGKATFYGTGLLVGDYTLHASFTPDAASDSLPAAVDRNFSVVKGDTATLVAGPLDPPSFGDPVDLGVSVTALAPAKGVPSGKVRFYSNSSPITGGLVTLDGDGQAVLTTTHLAVGTQDISAVYIGDDEFNASSDAVSLVGFTVNQGDVAVTLSSVHNPVIAGEDALFDVQVSSLTGSATKPTGDVAIYDNGDFVDSATIDPVTGKVQFSLDLAVTDPDGHHHVTAEYVGDGNYYGATSNFVDQTVNLGSAKVKLTSDKNPSHVGQDVTFSIDVDGNLPTSTEPTGEVQLYVNGTPFDAPVGLDVNGQATITTDHLPVGVSSVTATYLGDKLFKEATSGELKQVVEKQLVAVSLTASDDQLQYGQKLTLTASVATEKGDVATGQVQFYDHGVAVGAPVLVDGAGKATVSSTKTGKGSHQYSAKYLGDARNPEGVSNTVEVTVLVNELSFRLVTNKVPAYEGEDIVLHAWLRARPGSVGKIAGAVQYYSDGAKYGAPIPVNGNGWASSVVRRQKAGMHRFTARFLPSEASPFESATSAGVIQRVQKGKPNARVRMTVKRTSPTTAQVRVRVRKTNGDAAHGYVQLYVNGSPIRMVKLPNGSGVKTVTLTGLPSEQVFITANYRPRGKVKQAGKSLTLRAY